MKLRHRKWCKYERLRQRKRLVAKIDYLCHWVAFFLFFVGFGAVVSVMHTLIDYKYGLF